MAGTAASLMEGRFELEIGPGENLDEHILGDRRPPATVRIDMMREAIDVIRTLEGRGHEQLRNLLPGRESPAAAGSPLISFFERDPQLISVTEP